MSELTFGYVCRITRALVRSRIPTPAIPQVGEALQPQELLVQSSKHQQNGEPHQAACQEADHA